MYDEQFKQLARKPLSQQAKARGYNTIQSCMKKTKRKDRLGYATVLVLFTCFMFIFIQTLQAPKTSTEQMASELNEFGTMKEVTLLKNERTDKMFDITSIFYPNRVVTNNLVYLTALTQQFEEATMKPFEENLSNYEYSYDLFIEFEHGQSRYIKVLYGAGPIVTLDMETQQSYQVVDRNLGSNIASIYYQLKSEESFFSWNVMVAIVLLLIVLLYQLKTKKGQDKKKVEEPVTIGAGVMRLLIFGAPYLLMDRLFGSTHLAFLILWFFGFMFYQDAEVALKENKPVNWQKLFVNNVLLALILFLFFL